MKRTEFSDDVVMNNDEGPDIQSDEEEPDPFHPDELDPEAWHDWHSEHLLNMYMSLTEYCEMQGLQFMKRMTFNEFCDFLYVHS
jgi:hypothetical protein